MPWIKHEHSEVVEVMPPTCGVCGRVVDATQYHCAELACPYPWPPPAESTPPAPAEEAPVVTAEPVPTAEPVATPAEPAAPEPT
jgi:hypothetical protein